MTPEEIKTELHECTKRLAELTTKVLEIEGCLAAHLDVEITNVAGHSRVRVDLKTSDPADMKDPKMQKLLEVLQMLADDAPMPKAEDILDMKADDAIAKAEEMMRGLKKDPPIN